jgi:diaminopimelate epimerase
MKFVKMQATGNDFILIDARHLERDWSELARDMCQPHFGVGGDGLILLLSSKVADLRMRMFNPDGSEAEACGNGLRCLAKYAVESGLAPAQELKVETMAGIRAVSAKVEKGVVSSVRVAMGRPKFAPADVPANLDITPIVDYAITVAGKRLKVDILSMGNPHAVLFSQQPVDSFPLAEIGPEVENHSIFPNRTNFEVANVVSRRQIRARVWERGAGETLSCGTGACAIAVAARLHGNVDDKVDIMLPGGALTVDWDGAGEVYLSGAAEVVFEGEWKGRHNGH